MPRTAFFASVALVFVAGPSAGAADVKTQRLHQKIDAAIRAAQPGPVSPPAADAELLRRLSLDLRGLAPSADETRSYLAEKNPDKRVRWTETFLADPRFARHFANWLDVALMERRPTKYVPLADWEAYLFKSLQTGESYDKIV